MSVDATFDFEKRRNRPVKCVAFVISQIDWMLSVLFSFLFSIAILSYVFFDSPCGDRYDRELMGTTLRAMQRVGEIRARREEMYFERRMKDARKVENKQAKVELKESIELLVPAAADKEKVLLNVVEAAKVKAAARKAKKEKSSSSAAEEMDD